MRLASIEIESLHPHLNLQGGHAERYGPCPICGGTDRFHIKKFDDKDMFMCRQCHTKWGDAIEFLMWLNNCTFMEASGMLALAPTPPPLFPTARTVDKPDTPPDADWQSKALCLIDETERRLWSNTQSAKNARQWLNNRGLTDETIQLHRLGLSVKEGYSCDLFLHKGITIPTISKGNVWQVRTRTPDGLIKTPIPNSKPDSNGKHPEYCKYMGVAGGKVGLWGYDFTGSVTLLVGGEFDAMIVRQANPNIRAITFGSESKRVKAPWRDNLTGRIFVCYDNDDAGIAGAKAVMKDLLNAESITLPQGKDPTDFYLNNRSGCVDWLNSLTHYQ